MSDADNIVFDLLRAAGFVLAVVIGGLLIAGVIDAWNGAGPGAPVAEPESVSEPRAGD